MNGVCTDCIPRRDGFFLITYRRPPAPGTFSAVARGRIATGCRITIHPGRGVNGADLAEKAFA